MRFRFGPSYNAFADLVFVTNIEISGTGLGAVNTLVTVHDPGGPGNQNGIESGCINQNGSFTNCLQEPHVVNGGGGVQGGDNTAINAVRTMSTANSLAAVVNISETGQDLTATLTALYLTFCSGANCHTAWYEGPNLNLTQGGSEGTGLGNSGFTFALDEAQLAIVKALGPTVTVSGGLQFANGSTNDGNDTLHVIEVAGNTQIPEPGSLMLLGSGLMALGGMARRRFARRKL